jgi:hypothetical protein
MVAASCESFNNVCFISSTLRSRSLTVRTRFAPSGSSRIPSFCVDFGCPMPSPFGLFGNRKTKFPFYPSSEFEQSGSNRVLVPEL